MFIDQPDTFFLEGPERRFYIVHKKADVMNTLPSFLQELRNRRIFVQRLDKFYRSALFRFGAKHRCFDPIVDYVLSVDNPKPE